MAFFSVHICLSVTSFRMRIWWPTGFQSLVSSSCRALCFGCERSASALNSAKCKKSRGISSGWRWSCRQRPGPSPQDQVQVTRERMRDDFPPKMSMCTPGKILGGLNHPAAMFAFFVLAQAWVSPGFTSCLPACSLRQQALRTRFWCRRALEPTKTP